MTQEEVTGRRSARRPTAISTQTNWAVIALRAVDARGSPSPTSGPTPRATRRSRARARAWRTYAHELTHNLGLPDNYNNPFTAPYQQTRLRGMWDMMSRGPFNGPGGQHTRFLIPPTTGLVARLAAQHPQQALPELPHRRRPAAPQPQRPRAVSGMAVADVTAREVAPTGGEISRRDRSCSTAPATTRRRATTSTDPTCDGVRTAGHDDHRQVQQLPRWRSCSRSARTPSIRATAS